MRTWFFGVVVSAVVGLGCVESAEAAGTGVGEVRRSAELKIHALPMSEASKVPGKLPKKERAGRAKIAEVAAKAVTKKSAGRSPASAADGALISVSMQSSVGVLLDDFPASMKSRIRESYLSKPLEFWHQRAKMQVEATLYKLVYRNLYYNNKGQLPLPPPEIWNFSIGNAQTRTIDGHELVMVDFEYSSTLLATAASAIEADSSLAKVGGSWTEGFVLPADPAHLFERTGYSCMDEEDFPPNSVDSENALAFYDHACKGGNNWCHVTQPLPKLSCVAQLKASVGRVSAGMKFTRLAWSDALANQVRTGAANPGGADLEVQMAGLKNNRVIYRYINPGSCAIAEGCVGGSGWRRLLQFDGSVANRGAAAAHLGAVEDDSPLVEHNMFEFSACHGHRHFSHYGTFTYGSGAQIGSKRAFCMESTQRYSNNEQTPLTHPYSCHYQGIAAGWGDDYIAGIECQWMDVTNVDTSKKAVNDSLEFRSNPDQFICEGAPVLDANGDFTFVPTSFTTETGAPVDRIACSFAQDWDSNNFAALPVTLPQEGGYVTQPCTMGKDGEMRNCGFSRQGDLVSCTAGQTVQVSCAAAAGGEPQALRICETSAVLGVGIPCTYRDAIKSMTVTGAPSQVSFTCPAARDTTEPGGKYAIYAAPLHVGDAASPVTCVH